MYYTTELTSCVKISPDKLDNLKLNIKNTILETCEKKILSNMFIINILSIEDSIKDGIINDIDGSVNYKIKYRALVFVPEINSEINITITKCNEVGLWGYPTLIFKDVIDYLKNNVKIECVIPKDIITKYKFVDDKWKYNDRKEKKEKIIEKYVEINVKIINFVIESNKIGMICELAH
jgi:DNA-directed RNA polymerase subunit E'/Rpb7